MFYVVIDVLLMIKLFLFIIKLDQNKIIKVHLYETCFKKDNILKMLAAHSAYPQVDSLHIII